MATKEGPVLQQIELSSLTLPQLMQLKQQLDQEIHMFLDTSRTLRMAQTKFQDSNDCLEKITSDSEGKTIMVPLTGSLMYTVSCHYLNHTTLCCTLPEALDPEMYVPGRIANGKSVILDIGTGYYIQKDIEGAKDYFKRKVNFIEEQIDKVMQLSMEKSKLSRVVAQKIQLKQQSLLSSEQQQSQ